MKITLVLAALLLQLAAVETAAPTADPQHLRYERAIVLPANSAGQACVALDAGVFAHTASGAANDLRIFAAQQGSAPAEVAFNLSESETQAVDVESATVRNLGLRGGDIAFDLAMPPRPYSEVDLDLNAKNFLAIAKVSGSDGRGGPSTALGSFALFDLTRQHLSRSTSLPLTESTFAQLHMELHVTGLDGQPFPALAASIVEAASVPPSREAQTLYTTVANTEDLAQHPRHTLATFHVPAHVPLERIAFALDPAYTKNFLRSVDITAKPDTREPDSNIDTDSQIENVSGEVSRVHMNATSMQPIDSRKLTIDAALGADLSSSATVTVDINNGDDPPLGLRSVQLQMRRRTVCFDSAPAQTYTLRYGDEALHAPVYDYARLFQASATPVVAVLAAEQINPNFKPRADQRPYTERHPELIWIGLLAVVAALGATALQSMKRQGRKT